MRIPLPSVPQQPSSNGRFTAPAVTPQQDATGQQLAGIGEGLQQVGYEVSRYADFQQDRLDDARVTEADNLTADAVRQAWADPTAGYRAKIGQHALGGARKQADEDLDRAIEKIGATLDNDVQRAQWRRMADDRRRNVGALFDAHEQEQIGTHYVGTTKARAESARIDGDKRLMLLATDDLSRFYGEDETQRNLRRLDATTTFHSERIRILAEQDPATAAAMLAEAKAAKEIHPSQLDALQRVVRTADTDDKSLTLFRTIVEDPTRQDMSLAEQERIAKAVIGSELDSKRLSADVYDRTLQRIEHHFLKQHQARQQEKAELADQVEQVFVTDPAVTLDTLPQPMRERARELGILGELSQREAQARARSLTKNKRDVQSVELARDVQDMATLQKWIELVKRDPGPDTDDPAAQKEFAERQKEQLESLQALFDALVLKQPTLEAKGVPARAKAPPAKTVNDELRDAIRSMAAELYGGGK